MTPNVSKPLALLLLLSIPIFLTLQKLKRRPRLKQIPSHRERILILGGTSGIGECIAAAYAKRGAQVCVVGRREGLLRHVEKGLKGKEDRAGVLSVPADITNVDEMLNLRALLEQRWHGIDTLVVSAGVSAVQPLLTLAGYSPSSSSSSSSSTTTKAGIQRAVHASSLAIQSNYTGPLIAALTFIPLLLSSPSPSILLLSSLAALIPAPTRAIYAASKSASLLLYQSLAIEMHPKIAFTFVVPSTVANNAGFRDRAVDAYATAAAGVTEPNESTTPKAAAAGLKKEDVARRCVQAIDAAAGLKKEDVARRCIQAIDDGETRTVFIPRGMRWAHWIYWVWPGLIERLAARKYGYQPYQY